VACSTPERQGTPGQYSSQRSNGGNRGLLGLVVPGWMMVHVPCPCILSLVPPEWGGHRRKGACMSEPGEHGRSRAATGPGVSPSCVWGVCVLVPASHGSPQGCTSRQDLQNLYMYPVVSLACLWKALPNEWATAHQARAAYTFPMISVSLTPKHNPTSRSGAKTSMSCDGPRDLSSGLELAAT